MSGASLWTPSPANALHYSKWNSIMTDQDSPQLKMLKLAWSNLDWGKEEGGSAGSSFLSLPETETLSAEEREALECVVARDKRKWANMPMLRDNHAFRVAPLFAGLLQSPLLARFWAEIGDFFITAAERGTLTECDRAWIDMGLNPLIVNSWTQSGNICVAAEQGISAEDIVAIREGRLDSLAAEVRQIVDLAQATVRGCVSMDQFKELAARRGAKWVVEAIGYAVYRSGLALIVSAMWQIQGIEGGDAIMQEMIEALVDGSLGEQKMMDKSAFAKERMGGGS